jgi:predicted nucleic-acid-binding Zn-ribbon protein
MDDDLAADAGRPTCPLCGNRTFRQEAGKFDSEWGMTAHRVRLLICDRCRYVLAFYEGNSIFDFD